MERKNKKRLHAHAQDEPIKNDGIMRALKLKLRVQQRDQARHLNAKKSIVNFVQSQMNMY